MSGYRDEGPLWRRWWLFPADRWRLSYIATGLGFGFLAIALGNLVAGGSLIFSVVAALIGAASLTYGLRNY